MTEQKLSCGCIYDDDAYFAVLHCTKGSDNKSLDACMKAHEEWLSLFKEVDPRTTPRRWGAIRDGLDVLKELKLNAETTELMQKLELEEHVSSWIECRTLLQVLQHAKKTIDDIAWAGTPNGQTIPLTELLRCYSKFFEIQRIKPGTIVTFKDSSWITRHYYLGDKEGFDYWTLTTPPKQPEATHED